MNSNSKLAIYLRIEAEGEITYNQTVIMRRQISRISLVMRGPRRSQERPPTPSTPGVVIAISELVDTARPPNLAMKTEQFLSQRVPQAKFDVRIIILRMNSQQNLQ